MGIVTDWDCLPPGPGEPPVDDAYIADYEASVDPAVNGTHGNGRSEALTPQVLDAALVELVTRELDLVGPLAEQAAKDLAYRIRTEHLMTLARTQVRELRLSRDTNLDAIDSASASAMLARERPVRARVLGDLLLEGQNATVVARWKTGKSTLVDNVAAACVTGGLWLGRFPVPVPMRVALLNYELHPDDMLDRLAALQLEPEVQERLLVVNLRGHRLPLSTAVGRRWMARCLADHGARVVIVDPFGAAFAASGGESENDNAEVRGWLINWDEIKSEAGCPTLIMPVHTGRAAAVEGDEQGRGATVLEDWPDVRMILTKDKDNDRFLRTEGRAAFDLYESRLSFDPATRGLTLSGRDVGLSREAARAKGAVDAVVRVVTGSPGLNKTQLRDAMAGDGPTHHGEQDKAVKDALASGQIHYHKGSKGAQLHYPGPDHREDEWCSAEEF